MYECVRRYAHAHTLSYTCLFILINIEAAIKLNIKTKKKLIYERMELNGRRNLWGKLIKEFQLFSHDIAQNVGLDELLSWIDPAGHLLHFYILMSIWKPLPCFPWPLSYNIGNILHLNLVFESRIITSTLSLIKHTLLAINILAKHLQTEYDILKFFHKDINNRAIKGKKRGFHAL